MKRRRTHILSKHNSRQCADQYAQAIERVYRQRNLGVPGVAQNILRLTPHLVPSELPAFTSALSNNIPPKPQKPQLLLDVTELVHADARTGIQRVTRALLLEITFALGKDWSIEPVYATADQCGFRYARKFMSRLLGIPDDWAEDAPVQVWHGDVFLGLDYSPSIIPTQESTLKNWSARGIRLYFVVHDLLPVTMPEVFPEGSAQHQQRWLETMSLFDGAICVSRHVADELFEWLQVFGKKRERPFCIDWFHHGADLENSAPTRGLPSDAEKTLSAFTQRPTFLMVGTIEPRKGYLQTLQAFDRVWAQGVDANLVIVGKEGWKPLPDAQRRDIPQTVQALRSHPELGQRLFWLEGISDEYLEKVYAAASCLIAASFDEGFGLPLIEAAKHGLPLLVRDIPVFREVTANHAYIFENNRTPEAISTAVQTWLDLYKKGAQPRSDEMPIQTWHQSAQQVLSAIHQQKQHYKSWLPDGVRRYWGADPRLYSQVGLRFGKGIRTNGQAGHLLHGPYTQLPPGQYEVRLSALVHHATGLEVLAIVCDQGRTIILKKDHPFQSEGHVRIQERFELAELCKDFEFRLWVAEKTILIIDSVELATLSKEIEIYKASVLDQTYPFSANGNSIATHDHTGCHYYGPYVSLSEGRYRARYELEIVSGSVEFIYADVCTQQAESIEKSEFFVKNDGDKITVDIHFEFSSRKDKVEVRVLSSASTSLKLSGFSIFKKAPEYAESFVFVIKSYSKDLDWAYYNFLSCEKYTAPRANFYIVVPEKEVALFTDRFLRGMRDNEIRSLPFILSEEYIFQKTDQSIPEEFDGWHIQQVVKLCFSKTKIAKNYCTLDSAMIFTKAFDWENELFVGEQIVTTARRHDRKERNDFLLSIDEKGWLHGELVNISESFEYIEKSFKNESDITHHYIAGNGFFSSELLLELNTWSGDRGFTGLISAAPYEFAWYGSFVANRRKDVFFSRDPLIMFPVIDVESATRITEPPLNVPENFFGLLFQPPAINYISPKKIYDLYVK
jgi:glycosyltransferase involved in cell wall biosynthesis